MVANSVCGLGERHVLASQVQRSEGFALDDWLARPQSRWRGGHATGMTRNIGCTALLSGPFQAHGHGRSTECTLESNRHEHSLSGAAFFGVCPWRGMTTRVGVLDDSTMTARLLALTARCPVWFVISEDRPCTGRSACARHVPACALIDALSGPASPRQMACHE